jgi:hypothetical protein
MKTLLTAALLSFATTTAVLAADTPQRLSVNRSSVSDRITGAVVNGSAVALVYGGNPGAMVADQQALLIKPNGNKLDITYDTVGALGIPTQGLTPMAMVRSGGFEWPVYNMGGDGAN